MDNTAAFLQELGLWVGLVFSLLIFSAVAGDQFLLRLAQHILVGAGLGYTAILAIQHILRPFLWEPLAQSGYSDPLIWFWIVAALLLGAASIDRIAHQNRTPTGPPSLARRILYAAARLPLALLISVGLTTALVGAIQGTLLPQFLHAARTALDPTDEAASFIAGLFTLVLTTASILFLYVDPERRLANQPAYVRNLLAGWIWLGQRAVWVAAGILFARLLAARLSLLIARLDYFLTTLYDTGIWAWAESIWQAISGS